MPCRGLFLFILHSRQRGFSSEGLCLSRSFEEEEVKLRWSQASDKKFPFGAKYLLLKWPDPSYKEGTPAWNFTKWVTMTMTKVKSSSYFSYFSFYRCHLGFIDWTCSACNNPLWPSHYPLCPNICGYYSYDFCLKRESERESDNKTFSSRSFFSQLFSDRGQNNIRLKLLDCLRFEKMIPGCPGFQTYLKSELSIQKPGNLSEAWHF